MTTSSILRTEGLTVTFGGVTAIDGVSIDVGDTGLTGLIGPNGAGKSTLIDAVTGFLGRRVSGRVYLSGREVTDEPPHRRSHGGLARTWQSQELFDDVSVVENLQIAAQRLTVPRVVSSLLRRPRVDPAVEEALALLGLEAVARREPRELTHRDRTLVGVARAIVSRPVIALMDEPAAGLDRTETQWLAERLRAVVDSGLPILLVDHDMGLILTHCERVIVLDQGRVIADGPPEQITRDEAVIRAYLGTTGGGAS